MADIINGDPHAGNQTPVETEVNLDKMTVKEKCNKIIDILKPYSSKVSWDWGEGDGNTVIIKPGHGKQDIVVDMGKLGHPSVAVDGNKVNIYTGPDNTGGHWEYVFDDKGNLIRIVWVPA